MDPSDSLKTLSYDVADPRWTRVAPGSLCAQSVGAPTPVTPGAPGASPMRPGPSLPSTGWEPPLLAGLAVLALLAAVARRPRPA